MPGPGNSSSKRRSNLTDRLGSASHNGGKQVELRDTVEDGELMSILETVLEEGAALLFSRTSDGGALCLTFFVDDSKQKVYVANRQQWLELLERVRG
jgi:hypothetical protein